MHNHLFPFQNTDCNNPLVVDPDDFSAEENRTKWYNLADFIKNRKIDPALGRNTMLLFLRFMCLLTRDHRPRPGTILVKHLRVSNPSDGRSRNFLNFPYYMLQISGEGLCEIKKAIDLTRKKGGSI